MEQEHHLPIKREQQQSSLSVYEKGETTRAGREGVAVILFAAFPKMPEEFVKLLFRLADSEGFSDERLKDSVLHVVKTFKYEMPKIADFLTFDKKRDVKTHYEMCELVEKFGQSVWGQYKSVLIDGRKYWEKV